MTIREWEAAMLATGATKLRVWTLKKGACQAETYLSGEFISADGEDMETACTRLLEACQKR